MKGIFITGTDTGVGKTVLCAGLAAALRRRALDVGVTKPVATGAVRRNGKLVSADAIFLKAVAGVDDAVESICPLLFELPAAPNVAASHEGETVDLDGVRKALADLAAVHAFLLVEGIGGWRVPITDSFSVRELAVEVRLPVLVVARAGLGTINHTVLTVESVREAGLDVVGVVLVATLRSDDPTRATNAAQIERLTGADVLGCVPFDPALSVEDGRAGSVVTLIEDHVDVERIIGIFNGESLS